MDINFKPIPTVRPYPNFDAEKDALALRKAMKGLGTNEKVLIDILTSRSHDQRMQIFVKYKQIVKRDLIQDLVDETSSDFKKVIINLFKLPMVCAENTMLEALEYPHSKKAENACIEILFTSTNEEIALLSERFTKATKEMPLVDYVCARTAEEFHPFFKCLFKGEREPIGSIDLAKAKKLAQDLFNVGKGKLNLSMEIFYRMLATLSFAQLRLVFGAYQEVAGHSIHHAIKQGMANFPDALLMIGEFFGRF